MNTVFITGCSSGIGKATAIYFAEQGWNVVATMRNPKVVQDLKDVPHVLCLAVDVTQPHTIKRAIVTAIKSLGAIDVIVNNAGFGREGAFETASAQKVEDIFGTNVFGLMNVTRAILPHFRKRKRGGDREHFLYGWADDISVLLSVSRHEMGSGRIYGITQL